MPRRKAKPSRPPGGRPQTKWVRDSQAAAMAVRPHAGFTMRDEARNTASHQTRWDRDAKLRERPVIFISAGPTAPLDDLPKTGGSVSDSGSDEEAGETGGVFNDLPQIVNEAVQSDGHGGATQTTTLPLLTPAEEPGTLGTGTLASVGSDAENRFSSTGHDSDSSVEVILFKGRGSQGRRRRSKVNQTNFKRPKPLHQPAQARRLVGPASRSPDPAASAHGSVSITASTSHWKRESDSDAVADYLLNVTLNSDGDCAEHRLTLRELDDPDDFVAVADVRTSLASALLQHELSEDGDNQEAPKPDSTSADVADRSKASDQDSDSQDGSADLDDETLASILAKQEELGLGGDELVSSSRHYALPAEPSECEDSDYTLRTKARRNQGGPGGLGTLTAATVADAFDDMDLMDWAHPMRQSGRRKARKGVPNFGLSDSELEAVLAGVWQKDRDKKKEKRQQRERMRAQGLLRAGANPDDLRYKYATAMTFDDIKTEVKAFLLASSDRLEFPPLDASARKIVHDLANRFKIKSKSSGSGDQRRPVLYRTKATLRYGEAEFEMATSRVGRKYFPRLDNRGGFSHGRPGGGGGSAVTYRDGDVVGAAAPELGEGNKGRAMLEKMGWSTGMALGATDNKGILQPVAQVIKRSKAGLG